MKLKLLFYFSLLLLVGLEAWRAYLLLPMPGSQETDAVDTAHFLYSNRWIIRIVLLIGMLIGARETFRKRWWIPVLLLLPCAFILYTANFYMTAENFFSPPATVAFADPGNGNIPMDALVIGVTQGGESRAFPIRYLSFHHQVPVVIGGKPALVTYCDVCRSGIVFDPVINGKTETFRLVGMDQWNAMFEDESTGSWWRQANGECASGELKGQHLRVIESEQLTLQEWSRRHPEGKVMLPDPAFVAFYSGDAFEKGLDTDPLTRTDTASWQDKSWVIGVEHNGQYRAYDWNELKKNPVIIDTLGGDSIIVSRHPDGVNFSVCKANWPNGQGSECEPELPVTSRLPARQTFWHTWKTFYPQTTLYHGKATE